MQVFITLTFSYILFNSLVGRLAVHVLIMASASPRDDSGYCTLISSAIFVPRSGFWMFLHKRQIHQHVFLLNQALCLSPSGLAFPLHSLAFRLPPTSDSEPTTILFGAFHHVPSQQTHKLALRFPSASDLYHFYACLQPGAHSNPRGYEYRSFFPVPASGLPACSPAQEAVAPESPAQDAVAPEPLAFLAPSIPADFRIQEAPVSRSREIQNKTDGKDLRAYVSVPARVCPSKRKFSSISTSRLSETRLDAAAHEQNCNQDHVAIEGEYRQQSSPVHIEDSYEDIEPSPFDPELPESSNFYQFLPQSGAANTSDVHALRDSCPADLRSELLSCLLDPSFRLLVERVESLVAEIDDPSSVDLVALGDFLARRK